VKFVQNEKVTLRIPKCKKIKIVCKNLHFRLILEEEMALFCFWLSSVEKIENFVLVQWRDRFSDRAVRGVVPNLT
jgi:hypothetical protein